MSIKIETPINDQKVKLLKIGDTVEISGYIYTARDSAHKNLVDLLKNGEDLPFDIKGSIIYYVGPSPAKPGQVIGAAGPTTSYRMDPYVEDLMKVGMKGMIGKGSRSENVINCLQKYTGVYFGATGGAAALISKKIIEAEVIAFPELGPEAIRRLKVKDLPVVVINDCYGNDLYVEGKKKWAKE
ncbi:MAG TPA: Fe-S-containing hydro-lyase [Bacteroidales bacterium]|jgi:fumarate hydratase subunit beta|nr:Fe-S-containing hydro-lyase [Bacteroidales bacterium]MDD4234709.1 Fe-S-containing hydro-lyase [Bacteroidales bacterium]HXK81378.1 Fe-S-containing hydro-lyase [Bacteroidales bacterium]